MTLGGAVVRDDGVRVQPGGPRPVHVPVHLEGEVSMLSKQNVFYNILASYNTLTSIIVSVKP